MKGLKKVLAFGLAAVMVFGQAVTVLADSSTGTAGTGNILDYTVTEVVVPTALKIALNPNQYTITTKFKEVKDGEFEDDKDYYVKSNGAYKLDTSVNSGTTWTSDTFFTIVSTSDAQIVSLNYGILNKSSEAKTVGVEIQATYGSTSNSSGSTIQFVDAKEKAQPYVAGTNTDGALRGEHKMYLEMVTATGTISAETYKLTTDTKTNVETGRAKYFTKDATITTAPVYTAVTTEAASQATEETIKTYYEATEEINVNTAAKELADVTVKTTATTGNAAFATSSTISGATAEVAYKLDQGTYSLKDGETIDFGTTEATLKNKLELSAVGGYTAFTFTGAINKDADWTTDPVHENGAKTSQIIFTPIYDIDDIDGTEEYLGNGTKQIKKGYLSTNTLSPTQHSVSVNTPDDVNVSAVLLNLGGNDISLNAPTHFTVANNVYTFINDSGWSGGKIKFRFSDNKEESITLT